MFRNFFRDGGNKVFRSLIGRISEAVIQAAPLGSLVALILFYIFVLAAELLRLELSAIELIGALVVVHAVSITLMTLVKLAAGCHKYDQDIVGRNFVGVSKKCRLFSHALELHFNRRVNASLDEFKLLGSEYESTLTEGEKALVSFYTGRCYDQLRYYPNALSCYERAAEQGFDNSILPFLRARCTGANGDTDEAIGLYNEILGDEKSPFRNLVYNDIGRMFLDRNQPAEALDWYSKAIENRHSLPEAYGGAAIAQLMLGDLDESDRLYRAALVSHIKDPNGFTEYYKRILGSVMLKKDAQTAMKWMNNENN